MGCGLEYMGWGLKVHGVETKGTWDGAENIWDGD